MVAAALFADPFTSTYRLILLVIGISILAGFFLTRHHIPRSRVRGLKVSWPEIGAEGERSGVVVGTPTPGYLMVREEPFGAENVPEMLVRFALIDRLKYSWRR